MPAPTEVQSVTEWNTTLRAAKARTPPTPIVVDFHAQWCGPCKQIAPFYSQLASQHPHVQFLRVDVDAPGVRAIAQKYQFSAMPTFVAIQEGKRGRTPLLAYHYKGLLRTQRATPGRVWSRAE